MGIEKRLNPRVKTNFELKVQYAETFHWTMLRNLSAGGVFVQTETPLDVGSIVSMQLALPVDDEIMDIQGRVMWLQQASKTTAPGMGLEFTSISPKHQQKIINFIGATLKMLGKSA